MKRNRLIFYGLSFLTLLYVLPIIIANRYYNDDLSRALYGYTGWNGDGRPLTELLLKLLGGGSSLAIDVAPLPLLLAVFLLSVTLTIYYDRIIDFSETKAVSILSLFLFVSNPFLIYSWSYKYDVISMILSLSLILFLYSLPQLCELRWWIQLIISISIGIIVMMLYQPSIGLTVGLCVIGIFLFLTNKRDAKSVHRDVISLLGTGMGAIIYKLFLVGIFITEVSGDWRYNASQTVKISGLGTIKQILINLYNMVLYIYRFYRDNASKLFIILMIISIALVHVYSVFYCYKTNEKNRLIKAVFVAILPVISVLFSLAPLALLNDMSSRGRLFISFSGVLLLIGIELMVFSSGKIKKNIGIFIAIIFALYSFSFVYMYGNASNSQKEYEVYLASSIGHDIEEMAVNNEDYSEGCVVMIIGNTPMSLETKNLSMRYPAIEELVPVYISNTAWLGGSWLQRYVSIPILYEYESENDIKIISENEPVRRNATYSVYSVDERIYIVYE